MLSLLSATAVAGGHRVVKGSKGDDHLTMGAGNNRVFARGGDDTVRGGGGRDRLRGGKGNDALFGGQGGDRLRGGKDDDLLDGGQGDDYLNGGGDGGDPDEIVCGPGEDTVVLGRNDVVMVEAGASEHPDEGDAPESGDESEPGDDAEEPGDDGDEPGDDGDEPDLVEPKPGDDDGCEHVKRPGGEHSCASHNRECEDEGERPCALNGGGCEEPCAANYRDCDEPVTGDPEPDPPVEVPEPDEL